MGDKLFKTCHSELNSLKIASESIANTDNWVARMVMDAIHVTMLSVWRFSIFTRVRFFSFSFVSAFFILIFLSEMYTLSSAFNWLLWMDLPVSFKGSFLLTNCACSAIGFLVRFFQFDGIEKYLLARLVIRTLHAFLCAVYSTVTHTICVYDIPYTWQTQFKIRHSNLGQWQILTQWHRTVLNADVWSAPSWKYSCPHGLPIF